MARNRRLLILAGAFLLLLIALVGSRAQREVDADALEKHAVDALRRGDAVAAVAGYRKALARDRNHADSWAGLAAALHAAGDTLGAIATGESVVARSVRERWPLDAQVAARRALGLERYRARDRAGAIREMGAIAAVDAGTLETDLVLQLARLLEGQVADVKSDLPRLRVRYGDIEPVWKVGMLVRAAERAPLPSRRTLESFVSLRALPKAEALDPVLDDDPVARALLPAALIEAERHLEARQCAGLLSGGPFAAWGELQSARAALALGQLPEAATAATKLVADNEVPRETSYIVQAEVLQRQGQIEPAKTAVQRALEANPASTRASALLAGLRGSS